MANSRGSTNLDGSGDRIGYNSDSDGPQNDITTYPMSLCVWARGENVGGAFSQYTMSITEADTAGSSELIGIRVNTGETYIAQAIANSFFTDGPGSTLSNDVWYFMCVVWRSNTDREFFLDTVSDITASVSRDVFAGSGAWNESIVGALEDAGGNLFDWDGDVAYGQIYDADLSIAEQLDISKNPFSHPANLLYAANCLADASSIGDFVDFSPKDYTPNSGDVGVISNDAPPVHYYPGGF